MWSVTNYLNWNDKMAGFLIHSQVAMSITKIHSRCETTRLPRDSSLKTSMKANQFKNVEDDFPFRQPFLEFLVTSSGPVTSPVPSFGTDHHAHRGQSEDHHHLRPGVLPGSSGGRNGWG